MNIKEISFEKSFASHPKSKFWSKLNQLKPTQVFKCSGKKYLFNCEDCNHLFEMRLDTINNGSWCAFCNNKNLCENENCVYCFKKSFASHNKAKYLKDENPRMIFKNSNKKFKFKCSCNHIFYISLNNVNNNCWCPYCCQAPKKLCEDKNCKDCFGKSFASHTKSKFWSNKNKQTPRDVFKNSNKKFIFNCNKCIHSFDSTLNHIINGNWCPYCSGNKICFEENCKDCFDKSFASQEKSKFWSNKNQEIPRNICKSNNNKFWFNCNKCNNEFESTLSNIVLGRWCPHCKYKTELKLFEWLKEKYQNVQKQVTFDWSQKKRYDFVINNIIIELDGAQHFRQVSNWQSPEENKINDSLKNKLANENSFRMIRICQEIVLNDLEDWKNQLINAIKLEYTLINIGSVYS
jgi:very-short-patch-repair endonuclease